MYFPYLSSNSSKRVPCRSVTPLDASCLIIASKLLMNSP